MGHKKKVEDKHLEVLPEVVFTGGLDSIGSTLDEYFDEEVFDEEKAVEKKGPKEKKKTTKEFGEW